MKISVPWRVVPRDGGMRPYIVDATGRMIARVGAPGDPEERWNELATGIVEKVNQGEFVTCVYCGWFSGTQEEIRSSPEKQELCRQHELECPEHPTAGIRRDAALLAKIRRMAATAREGRAREGARFSGARWAAWVLTEAERGADGST